MAQVGTRELEQLWRDSAPRVLAALVRRFGDFDTAEDALQEALLAASRQWPDEGVPANPTGWLLTVASRRLIDQWRSDAARVDRERMMAEQPSDASSADYASAGKDDSLPLLVLCCHPALPRPAQVALTLRAVGGLTTGQIARAFLVPEATMAQRISRAKARLRQAGARFPLPPAAELPARVAAVAEVLYLVFTEGHTSTSGAGLLDVSLSSEAIRLTRQLHRQLPGETEIAGLLALMLLTDARRDARIGADGTLIPLTEQDRTRWDAGQIAEGVALIEAALPSGPVGPYQLQAAIAAVHAEAAGAEHTDWAQIETLYRMLATVAPGPMVTLNHAVALAMVAGSGAGLAMLEPLLADRRLRHHHRLPAVRAHLLELTGERDQARESYTTAARLATSIPEQRYLLARAAALRPDQVAVSRRIQAPAAVLFAILADPRRHPELDGSGMLRGAGSSTPVGAVGDVFVIDMYYQPLGDYQMNNHVVEFERDRRIGWEPAAGRGHPDEAATDASWGQRWSFELTPDGPDATVVTHRYDCSRAPEAERAEMAGGQVWLAAMTETLRRLADLAAHGLRGAGRQAGQ